MNLDSSVDFFCRQEDFRNKPGGYFSCFANVHSVTEAYLSEKFLDVLRRADFVFPDGRPLVWLSQLFGQELSERVCGPDFMKATLGRYGRQYRFGFIGGAPGQAEKIAAEFKLDATCYCPPRREFTEDHAKQDWEAFLQLCPDRKPPSIIWVGLGAPKQEFWMNAVTRNWKSTESVYFFGVGAAFDFLSGTKKRAPRWMQGVGLEWLYRFLQEPSRLWKRYLIRNALFFWLCIREVFNRVVGREA